MSAARDNGGPAFPNPALGNPDCQFQSDCTGLTARDYFASHSVQPGCGEIATMAGLVYRAGSVWSDKDTRVAGFDEWFNGLPLEQRFELFARVKYAMADAMLKARQS